MKLDQIISMKRAVGDDSFVVPDIKCRDGFTISVQASDAHYCLNADGRRPWPGRYIPLPFSAVEVGFPSGRPEPWDVWREYAEDPDSPTGTVYGFVPVQTVRELIASHGGEL